MKRHVIVEVGDERTDFLGVYECRGDPMPGEQSELLRSFDVPVPSDDQLTRAVQEAVATLQEDADDFLVWARTECDGEPDKEKHFRQESKRKYEMAHTLRAAFDLDEGNE